MISSSKALLFSSGTKDTLERSGIYKNESLKFTGHLELTPMIWSWTYSLRWYLPLMFVFQLALAPKTSKTSLKLLSFLSRTASNCWWFPWGTLKNQQKQLNQLQCDIHLGHPWIISIHSLWTSETKPVCQVHSKHLWVFWYPTHLPATKQSVCYLDTCAFPSTYLLHRYSKWNLVSLPTQTIVSFHETDVCRVVKTI